VKAKIRTNVVTAACYFVYTCVAATLLIFIVGVNSQGVSGNVSMALIFVIVLTSPVPMLLVGLAFLRHWRWAPALAVALALTQLWATAMQSQMAQGTWISKLSAPRAALFYICNAQTFYLPGSLLLAALSSVAFLFGLSKRALNRTRQQ
jgi:hypothetical protein